MRQFQADDDSNNIWRLLIQASAGIAVVSILYPVFC